MGAGCGRGRRRPGPRQKGSERDPEGEGEGGAGATHCGYQVLQGPAEPHAAAEALLQVLQGEVEARGHLDSSYPGDGGLWGTSSALVASALPPEANFSLHSCPWRKGGGAKPQIPTSVHTPVHTSHPHSWAREVCPGRRINQRRTFLHSHWWLIGPGAAPLCVNKRTIQSLWPAVVGGLLYTGHDFNHFTARPGGKSSY